MIIKCFLADTNYKKFGEGFHKIRKPVSVKKFTRGTRYMIVILSSTEIALSFLWVFFQKVLGVKQPAVSG